MKRLKLELHWSQISRFRDLLSPLLVGLLLAPGCGEGPAGAGTDELNQDLPPSNEQQPLGGYQSGGNDYQRPQTDSQARPLRDVQALGGAQSPTEPSPLDVDCDELCADDEQNDCSSDCELVCELWRREGGAPCIAVLTSIVACVAQSNLDCASAAEVCSLQFAAQIQGCPIPMD